VPAVATALPDSRHQFCQVHYLRHLAEPLAAADAAFKSELRKTVRAQVGDILPATPLSPSAAPAVSPPASTPEADEVLTHLVGHTRYWLTLKGRPPFCLAGLETYERLHSVACLSLDLLATRYDPRLAHLYQGLQTALAPFAQTYDTLHQGAAWLRDIAYILEPVPTFLLSAADVAGQLRGYLDTIQRQPKLPPTLETFRRHLDTVSRSYWPGLFHCYEVPGLPRTNNELESHFRETRRRLLQITGQQGQTQRTL
jgi:hypothetical protein